MRKLQVIGVGVGATLIAIVLLSFFFPKSWRVEESIRIDANIEVVYELIADAQEQLTWNPGYAGIPIAEADTDGFIVETPDSSQAFQLVIEHRVPRQSVDAVTSRGEHPQVIHRWDLAPDGVGTRVTWTAHSALKRRFLARFANLPLRAWMAGEITPALRALQLASERRQIETR